MEWIDEITLIKLVEPEQRVNSGGFANKPEEKETVVFCNKKSVGYAEFYKSQQAGFEISFKAEVHTTDYNGEKLAEFEGKRYSVLKTYEISDDVIELTLSNLRQQ